MDYDNWKLACCGRYPDCDDCPFTHDYKEDEADAFSTNDKEEQI